jgi:hypothetical protein
MLRVVLLGCLALSFVSPASAQREIPSRTFVVNVLEAPPRFGGGPNERYLTFHRSIEVPGARLVAGTYVFRVMGTSALQVLSENRQHVYTTFLTLRGDGGGDATRDQMKFQQFDEEGPLRILAWYPADSVGFEFLYPKPKRESVDRRER